MAGPQNGDAANPSGPVGKLVGKLRELNRPATLNELKSILQQVTLSRQDLTDYIRFNPLCYARVPVASNQHFELLCICWKSGQSSLIHDHRGSGCGVRVIEGELIETIFESPDGETVRPVRTQSYQQGYVCSSYDRDIHQISNFQQGDRELITLHIYSPPLAQMQTYEAADEIALANDSD